MKKIFLLFGFLLCILSIHGQYTTIDWTNIQNVSDNHAVTFTHLTAFKNQVDKLKSFHDKIAKDVSQIALIRDRMYISLKDVQSINKYSRAFNQINKLTADIYKYQSQMLSYASDDPKLIAVAISAETELIKELINILSYLEMAVNGESDNLMNVKSRLQMLNHVIIELRKARGKAYTVVRKMKMAKNRGLFYALTHDGFSYHRNQEELKNNILNNYKPTKK